MPNIESARKRARQALKRNASNRAVRSAVGSLRAEALAAIEAGNKAAAEKACAAYASELDKAAKKGVIKANNASRKKSRLALQVKKLA
jgi:small subunit ribosomal protein S20